MRLRAGIGRQMKRTKRGLSVVLTPEPRGTWDTEGGRSEGEDGEEVLRRENHCILTSGANYERRRLRESLENWLLTVLEEVGGYSTGFY